MNKPDARKLLPTRQRNTTAAGDRLRKSGSTYMEIAEIVWVNRNTVFNYTKMREREGAKGLKAKLRAGCTRHPRNKRFKGWLRRKTRISWCWPLLSGLVGGERVHEDSLGSHHADSDSQGVFEVVGLYSTKIVETRIWTTPRFSAVWRGWGLPDHCQTGQERGGWNPVRDEARVRSDGQHGRGYPSKGKAPVIRLLAKRASISMISSITSQGKVRFMLYRETMNAKMFIKFIKQLLKEADRKIFLILDYLRVHHARVVKDRLKDHTKKSNCSFSPRKLRNWIRTNTSRRNWRPGPFTLPCARCWGV